MINRFKLTGSPIGRSISFRMDKLIKNIQKDLQRKENIEYGRNARVVTFQFASQELAKKMEGKLK